MTATIICLEIICVSGLLWSIRLGKPGLEALFKTSASLVFLSWGLLRLFPLSTFGLWIAGGLLAALAGDLLLLKEGAFAAGLGAFLLCHLAYICAFSRVLPFSALSLPISLPILVAALAVLLWLRPHCGRLRIPVLLYIMAITLMTIWAISALNAGRLPLRGAVGALLFFLSDLFVARHRFVHRHFLNRFLGLPLYYASQLLMASLITGNG